MRLLQHRTWLTVCKDTMAIRSPSTEVVLVLAVVRAFDEMTCPLEGAEVGAGVGIDVGTEVGTGVGDNATVSFSSVGTEVGAKVGASVGDEVSVAFSLVVLS